MKNATLSLIGLMLLQALVLQAIGCARPGLSVNAAPSAVPAVPGQPAPPGERFAFPADKGGQALGQLLRPTDRLSGPLDDLPPGPRTLPPPVAIANPIFLPASPAAPVRPPLPGTAAIRPRMMAEGPPLTAYRQPPLTPTQHEFMTGVMVALPIGAINQPAPLGYLGVLVPDRVPLDDPTEEASRQAMLAAVPPLRQLPVPFAPQNLPDPFQNAQTVRVRTPPAEQGEPPTSVHSKAPPPVPRTQPK